MAAKPSTPKLVQDYWQAIAEWRAADRHMKRLAKKVPAALRREPRVMISYLLKGRDDKGQDIREPIYAHSEFDIEYACRRDCETQIGIWASPMRFLDKRGKLRTERLTQADREKRRTLRARYKARRRQKIEELQADQEQLFSEQRKVGWRQAVEAEWKAQIRVAVVRHAMAHSKPVTVREAVLLLETFARAEDMENRSSNEMAPYGFPYAIGMARNVARFLSEKAAA